jgi:deoxyribodipyrimidine photo-lyase
MIRVMKTPINDKALATLSSINPVIYARERNYLGKSTKLSVYITRSVLTLPQIKAFLSGVYTSQENYKLIFELAWREYWQREWMIRGDAIFADIKLVQTGVESEDLPSKVLSANTGVVAIDDGINELYETGYIHNHMRMWLSGLICNIGHTRWQQPAKWMYFYLLDGDPASNFLSWQWVAGTFSSKRYLPAQENINRYSGTKQSNTFLDKTYDELSVAVTPSVLKDRQPIDLTWLPPKSDNVSIDPARPTLLYHSFWLNADWHKEIAANRILIIEPMWFNKFPVSSKVMESIIEIAREIPDIQIYVGDIKDLAPKLSDNITFVLHPSVKHWPGTAESMPLLFPDVPLRSFNSFMSFWKQCEKHL